MVTARNINGVLGEDSTFIGTAKRWFAWFKGGDAYLRQSSPQTVEKFDVLDAVEENPEANTRSLTTNSSAPIQHFSLESKPSITEKCRLEKSPMP